jgi:hypothetical protein
MPDEDHGDPLPQRDVAKCHLLPILVEDLHFTGGFELFGTEWGFWVTRLSGAWT